MTAWTAPYVSTPVCAVVRLPGSKSITNRALILAALATSESTIVGALRSRDTNLMIDALTAMGTDCAASGFDGTSLTVRPAKLHGAHVDCGLAGTVMRFVPAVAALAHGPVEFDGDEQAKKRPLLTVLDALRGLGATVIGDSLPFTVDGKGRLRGGEVSLDASGSSQFVSALLLSAASYDHGIVVHHNGKPVPSMPHIDMTVDMLRTAGVQVETPAESGEANTWRVHHGPVAGTRWVIEPDLSNATPFLAAAAATAGSVTVPNWPHTTTQPGDVIREILTAMGADVRLDNGSLCVRGPGNLGGIDVDLHDVGELTPTVAALAALADGPSWLRGIAHLRGHETDRLAALATEIGRLGGNATETDDGLRITPARMHGGVWRSYADHRMATAGAILGLRIHGVEVDDIGTTAKTLPNFESMWFDMIDASSGPVPEFTPSSKSIESTH